MNNDKDNLGQDALVFAINPAIGIDPAEQPAAVQRLETYLGVALSLSVMVLVRESYQETLTGLERGEIDVAQLGPYAFALAQARFGAMALANTVELASLDDKDSPAPYRSVIFTRSDSGITSLAQLKGQPFGFVDRNSTTGYLVATFLLQQGGLDPAQQLDAHFQHSHRAVAEGVLSGYLAAGATMETEFVRHNQPIERPAVAVVGRFTPDFQRAGGRPTRPVTSPRTSLADGSNPALSGRTGRSAAVVAAHPAFCARYPARTDA